jgi:hypothetical protein
VFLTHILSLNASRRIWTILQWEKANTVHHATDKVMLGRIVAAEMTKAGNALLMA